MNLIKERLNIKVKCKFQYTRNGEKTSECTPGPGILLCRKSVCYYNYTLIDWITFIVCREYFVLIDGEFYD